MESDFIWMDGELVPFAQANIHVITPTLHYGVGVFEGIRSYQTPQGPAIFRLRDHLERFLESIQVLGIIDYPYSIDHIRQAVHDTILANGFGECYIRPLMYLDGPLGLNMDLSSPKLAIATWESKAARDAAAELQGPDVQAIIESQADWVTIQFIGEFEAPQWEVLPDSLVGS